MLWCFMGIMGTFLIKLLIVDCIDEFGDRTVVALLRFTVQLKFLLFLSFIIFNFIIPPARTDDSYTRMRSPVSQVRDHEDVRDWPVGDGP